MIGAALLAKDAVGAVGSAAATGLGAVGGVAAMPLGMGVRGLDRAGSAAIALGGDAVGTARDIATGLGWVYGQGVKLVGELGYEALKAGTRVVDRAGSAVVEAPSLLARGIGRGIAGATRGIRDGRGFLDQVGLAVAEAEGDAEREDPR